MRQMRRMRQMRQMRQMRIEGAGHLSLIAALAGALASPACAPSALRGASIANPLEGPDAILALGRSGDVVYALTLSRKLRTWDLRTRSLQTLNRGDAIGLSRDGAVALSASDTVVTAWEPTSGRSIATHRFDDGIRAVHGVSRATAYVLVKRPQGLWPMYATAAPPPDHEFVSWDLASGKIDVISVSGCDRLSLSADGARVLCDLSWGDRLSSFGAPRPRLAPEWPEPPPEAQPDRTACAKCAPRDPEPTYDLLSAWLSDDGATVYVTYRRATGGEEWRLERWIPDPAKKTEWRLERLAVSHEPTADRVLAASRDGRTVVTDPGRRPPILRHAPGYEGVPLLAPPVTAAVFSEDDRHLVTGHGDGRLRLWRADTGRFEAISPD
jgi:hypothetical protein